MHCSHTVKNKNILFFSTTEKFELGWNDPSPSMRRVGRESITVPFVLAKLSPLFTDKWDPGLYPIEVKPVFLQMGEHVLQSVLRITRNPFPSSDRIFWLSRRIPVRISRENRPSDLI